MGMIGVLYAVTANEAEQISSDPDALRKLMRPSNEAGILSIEKAWHGLHFLLTGDPFGGDFPLAFLAQVGGEPVEGLDIGYGAARLFQPGEVQEIHSALTEISEDHFWSRFDPEQMTEAGVYPGIWDEPEGDLREEYVSYFRELKEFMKRASDKTKLVLVTVR